MANINLKSVIRRSFGLSGIPIYLGIIELLIALLLSKNFSYVRDAIITIFLGFSMFIADLRLTRNEENCISEMLNELDENERNEFVTKFGENVYIYEIFESVSDIGKVYAQDILNTNNEYILDSIDYFNIGERLMNDSNNYYILKSGRIVHFV